MGQVDENLNSLVPETDEQEISCVSPLTLITSCSSPSISTSPPPLPPSPDMDIIKDQIRLLMEGRPYEELHEFCDFSILNRTRLQPPRESSLGPLRILFPLLRKVFVTLSLLSS